MKLRHFTERPAGSNAKLLNPHTGFPTFTPDKAGMCRVSLSIDDGATRSNASTYMSVAAPALSFVPTDARYSHGLDKVVLPRDSVINHRATCMSATSELAAVRDDECVRKVASFCYPLLPGLIRLAVKVFVSFIMNKREKLLGQLSQGA